jgi:hypothetical protein
MKKCVVFFFSLYCITSLAWANYSSEYPHETLPVKNFKSVEDNDSSSKLLPLTDLYITKVSSTLELDGEEIYVDQIQTQKHHGGTKILVTTIEIGSASLNYAYMNGNKLPPSSLEDTLDLCKKRGGGIGPCDRGESIIGHRRLWNVAGYGNGQFILQMRSNEYPYKPKDTKLHIK